MNKDTVINLAFDLTRGKMPILPDEYKDKDPSDVLRNALIAANNGSTKIDKWSLRKNGSQIYEILEILVPTIVRAGLQGDEFYMNLVEERRAKDGDSFEFWAEDNSNFIVSQIANGIATARRQRIGEKTKVSVSTTPHIITAFDEWSRFMARRIDWGRVVEKTAFAFKQSILNDIGAVFTSISAATPGLGNDYIFTGVYDEEEILKVVEHVEAATGKKAVIVGTKAALRKCKTAVMSDEANSNYFNGGYFGKLAGVDMVAIMNRHKLDSTEFIFPDDVLYVLASDDKPIKVCYEGDAFIEETSRGNADMTMEYTYIESYGVGLLVNGPIGKCTLTAA